MSDLAVQHIASFHSGRYRHLVIDEGGVTFTCQESDRFIGNLIEMPFLLSGVTTGRWSSRMEMLAVEHVGAQTKEQVT